MVISDAKTKSDAKLLTARSARLGNSLVLQPSWGAGPGAAGLAPPGAAAGFGHPLGGCADRLGALAQVVQVLLHPQQVRMNGWRCGCGSVDSGRGAGGSRAIRRGRAPGRTGAAGDAGTAGGRRR